MELGLQDRMIYARYLEHGTKYIEARNFLSDPLEEVAAQWTARILEDIGFDG
jgi:hypothetical protein